MKRYENNLLGNYQRVADLLHSAASALNRRDDVHLKRVLAIGSGLMKRDRAAHAVIGNAMKYCRRSLRKRAMSPEREFGLELRRQGDIGWAEAKGYVFHPWDWAKPEYADDGDMGYEQLHELDATRGEAADGYKHHPAYLRFIGIGVNDADIAHYDPAWHGPLFWNEDDDRAARGSAEPLEIDKCYGLPSQPSLWDQAGIGLFD